MHTFTLRFFSKFCISSLRTNNELIFFLFIKFSQEDATCINSSFITLAENCDCSELCLLKSILIDQIQQSSITDYIYYTHHHNNKLKSDYFS